MKVKGKSSLESQLSAAFAASEDIDEGDVLGVEKQKKEKETSKPKTVEKPISPQFQFDSPQFDEEPTTFETQLSTKEVTKIVRLYSTFVKMDTNTQCVVLRYLNIKAKDFTAEEVVVAALNANQSDFTLLSSLTKLKNESGASRAFELIAMSADELIKLDKLVSSFNKDYKQTQSIDDDRIKFCKDLEKGISTLNPNATQFLEPVEKLLKIAFS